MKPGDVVVATHQAQIPYLEKADYLYRDRQSLEYSRVLCSDGEREHWAGKPMIASPEELVEILRALPSSADLWLLGHEIGDAPSPFEEDLLEALQADEVHAVADGRLAVYRFSAPDLPSS
jgi:hypothetical protein